MSRVGWDSSCCIALTSSEIHKGGQTGLYVGLELQLSKKTVHMAAFEEGLGRVMYVVGGVRA